MLPTKLLGMMERLQDAIMPQVRSEFFVGSALVPLTFVRVAVMLTCGLDTLILTER
jgi:hypothetical protein